VDAAVGERPESPHADMSMATSGRMRARYFTDAFTAGEAEFGGTQRIGPARLQQ
jgi:hypothetical protein